MRRIFAVALLVAMTVALAPIEARTVQRSYDRYGVGISSCGTWMDARRLKSDDAVVGWVAGFVTGVGWTSSATLRNTDVRGIVAYVDQYCGSRPLDKIVDATVAMVKELQSK